MSLSQAGNAFDLLGQADKYVKPVHLPEGTRENSPKLAIEWGSFHYGFGSSLQALVTGPRAPKEFLGGEFFRECWIQSRAPRLAIVAAALWHIVFLIFPFPQLPARARTNPEFENTVLTWSGPINDLPPLEIPGPKAKPSPRGAPNKPLPAEGAVAFHPRQRIFTDPVHPNHPRQTLINPLAPAEAPKILPNLPNIVLLPQSAAPARPRMEISERTLANLRPTTKRRTATVPEAPLPDLPNLETTPAEINLANSPNAPARPKLELNAGAAPRMAQRKTSGDAVAEPELGQTQSNSSNSNLSPIIALSNTPAPPAPNVQPPQGNLTAFVSISPEGKKSGAPGGFAKASPETNGGSGGGPESHGGAATGIGDAKNSTAVSISAGNPAAKSSVSGLGGIPKISAPTAHRLNLRPDAHAGADESAQRTGPPNFAALPPGVAPEQVFRSKKIYKLLVNMPNLNSATGSWILNFSELHPNTDVPRSTPSDLTGPAVAQKVDPKYPPDLIKEHVEGEVILYAVIRSDGSVDGIQLVRGIDEHLDSNAMQALSQWKFRPGSRQGTPVEIEAIVHIPFHTPSNR
jgi:TonB family protein